MGITCRQQKGIKLKQNQASKTDVEKDHLYPSSKAINTTTCNAGNSSKTQDAATISCNICHKRFTRKSHMKRHTLAIHQKVKHKCQFCPKAFTQKCLWKTHVDRTHKGEKHVCRICEKSFSTKYALAKHEVVRSKDEPIQCSLCLEMCPNKCYLFSHNTKLCLARFNSDPKSNKGYVCQICKKAFSTKYALSEHEAVRSKDEPIKCSLCLEMCLNKCYLFVHNKKLCLARFNSDPKSSKEYVCQICEKAFSTKDALADHEAVRSKDEPMKCSLCLEMCLNKCYLFAHKTKLCPAIFISDPKSSKDEAVSVAKTDHGGETKTKRLQLCQERRKNTSTELSISSQQKVQCELCNETCANKLQLRRHKKSKHTCTVKKSRERRREVPCTCFCHRCGLSFSAKSKLRHHNKITHDTTEFVCEDCGKMCLGKVRYELHKNTHTVLKQRMVKCELCNETCASQFQLQKHKKTKHFISSVVQKPICCDKCGGLYKNRDAFRKHVKHGCSGIETVTPLRGTVTEEKRKVCEICGMTFLNGRNYKRHIHRVHMMRERAFSCETCGKSFFDRNTLNRHKLDVHSPKQFLCNVCNRRFSFKSRLSQHQRTAHLKEKPHKCDLCPKSFTGPYKLRMHKRAHSGNKPFFCEVCGQAYKYFTSLRRHKETHTGHRRYTCQFCPSRFWQKVARDKHEMSHTKDWKYICQYCGKGFVSPSKQRQHEQRKCCLTAPDGQPRQKRARNRQPLDKYTCLQCGKKYASYSGLYMHKQWHTGVKPFACSICDRRFSLKHILTQHMFTHTGEKPYQCTICDARFACFGNRKRHMKVVHDGLKLFKCDVCGQNFGQKIQVQAHKKTQHKIKTGDGLVQNSEGSSVVNYQVVIL